MLTIGNWIVIIIVFTIDIAIIYYIKKLKNKLFPQRSKKVNYSSINNLDSNLWVPLDKDGDYDTIDFVISEINYNGSNKITFDLNDALNIQSALLDLFGEESSIHVDYQSPVLLYIGDLTEIHSVLLEVIDDAVCADVGYCSSADELVKMIEQKFELKVY
ncbi:hypothetical protein [Companilactobacillus mishanensis]|uniref:Uncharacterized protein n=1 Tax=Companilactobacillus mishanensis TaxID=2486008 RepID=A0A5P0ZJC9_9LACO|nr:hypothetical protein [Companilactobacillus mishanensis]MQS44627.1 hypothetical protein [Companilactobacillus mishanensis]MQS53115.1 hypothetical protein [Companilactobacillus mishanensis]